MSAARRKRLRDGFTTGTAAAASAYAALAFLLNGEIPESVNVPLPSGGELKVGVDRVGRTGQGAARASVIKDAGDDPDVTNKACIGATVSLTCGKGPKVEIEGGSGVGRVTRPGLPVPPGKAAINPTPLSMIRAALEKAWQKSGRPLNELCVKAEIWVKDGEKLAERTLNPRLGIKGGISILGTSGLVKPMSHEAYTATIASSLDVARAAGLSECVFSTGRRSEKRAQEIRPDLPDLAFVQIADYFEFAMRAAVERGFSRIGLVSFFGKAVKQAQALGCTHADKAPMNLDLLAQWLKRAGATDSLCREIAQANTARHSLEIIRRAGRMDLAPAVGPKALKAMRTFAGPAPKLWFVMLDYDHKPLYDDSLEGNGGAHA